MYAIFLLGGDWYDRVDIQFRAGLAPSPASQRQSTASDTTNTERLDTKHVVHSTWVFSHSRDRDERRRSAELVFSSMARRKRLIKIRQSREYSFCIE
jgi:hypothetical protein